MLKTNPDELIDYAGDFSRLHYQIPIGVYQPNLIGDLVKIIDDANHFHHPLTIRCQGLSQGGQSIAPNNGYVLSMLNFNQLDEISDNQIWVSAANTWEQVLAKTLPLRLAPMALPYNCQLSVSGVLSAGGMGAGAFKYGPMIANVSNLEIVDGRGMHAIIDRHDDRFHAILGGQGNFGILVRAGIPLRPVKSKVKTWFLLYYEFSDFLAAITLAREHFDYIESFCSASSQGAIVYDGQKKPLTHWLYGLHVSLEYEGNEPDDEVVSVLSPCKRLHQQSETIDQYFLRHNHRFDAMQKQGLWSMMHPWYECYIDQHTLTEVLPNILAKIPTVIAPLIHIIPIKLIHSGMLMFPEKGPLFSFMILNPGLPHSYKSVAIDTMNWLNDIFLPLGGKRYLSGYQGDFLEPKWWQTHFGDKLSTWIANKQKYDPNHIFTSKLFENMPIR
ncbi:FAD-binding protein [Legionella sp. W05-934-2]|uniref:FAD-binding protein n=1 Tax=Legionella sp. W05-934-2 TaxID=1198649 RepID=UPI0034622531